MDRQDKMFCTSLVFLAIGAFCFTIYTHSLLIGLGISFIGASLTFAMMAATMKE